LISGHSFFDEHDLGQLFALKRVCKIPIVSAKTMPRTRRAGLPVRRPLGRFEFVLDRNNQPIVFRRPKDKMRT